MDQLYKDIVNFQRRCNDWLDQPSSPDGRSLSQEVQRLEDDVQVRKNASSVEGRVKNVIQLLHRAGDSGTMSHNHADELIDQCEQFRSRLQKLR